MRKTDTVSYRTKNVKKDPNEDYNQENYYLGSNKGDTFDLSSLSSSLPDSGNSKRKDNRMRHTADVHKSKDSDDHNSNGHVELYKTELCRTFLEKGSCRYGAKCQFAHGIDELRSVQRHPRYKTEICKSYHSLGTCKYGHRCRFIHISPEEDMKSSLGLGTSANLDAFHQKAQEGQKNLDTSSTTATTSSSSLRKKSVSTDMDPGSVPFAPNDKDKDNETAKDIDKEKAIDKTKDKDKDKENKNNDTPERSRSSFSPSKFKKDRISNSSPITSPESFIHDLPGSSQFLSIDFGFSSNSNFDHNYGSPINEEQPNSPLGTMHWIESQQHPSTSPLISNNMRSTAGSSLFMNQSSFTDFQNSQIESPSISLLTDLNQNDDLSFGFDGSYKNDQNIMPSLLTTEMNFNNNLLFPDIKTSFYDSENI